MSRVWVSTCLAVCLLAVTAASARAQMGSGQITGTVVDQDGSAVPGATITATSAHTSAMRTTVSTTAGL